LFVLAEIALCQTDFEVPAGGSASVKTTNDKIEYEVNVTDIDKVTAAQIHPGEKGKDGPVILTLFKGDPTELKTGKKPYKGYPSFTRCGKRDLRRNRREIQVINCW
jgi:hypothetical protein